MCWAGPGTPDGWQLRGIGKMGWLSWGLGATDAVRSRASGLAIAAMVRTASRRSTVVNDMSVDHEVAWSAGVASPGRYAGQPVLPRVEVTEVEWDGAMRRRKIDTAGHGDSWRWQELIARARGCPIPYRPVPGNPIYYLRLDDRDFLIDDHDLTGPLLDLVTAVLALGEAM